MFYFFLNEKKIEICDLYLMQQFQGFVFGEI